MREDFKTCAKIYLGILILILIFRACDLIPPFMHNHTEECEHE